METCLHSVSAACQKVDSEVIVVDNNSVDGSISMVHEKFPWVKTIANTENTGFSKANNQAIRISGGEYVLLLNPDTVVEPDTFEKIVNFMDSHPDAGGLGVKMIDGKGRFLPESKRGLPTPRVAFYKVFGLAALFPKSKTFGQYHLGFLDNNKVHAVDVLSGAFMLLRKETLNKVGLLDEDFFMYGEDIDLSYRITKGGYRNYYFPETRIIHYKGESTKKSSVNYVFVFYNAMIIFAKKHFTQNNARMFSFLINLAIYFRASLSIAKRFFNLIFLPLVDTILVSGGLLGIIKLWSLIMHLDKNYYPNHFIFVIIPFYTLIWLISALFSGGYDKPISIFKLIKGVFYGSVIILVTYALLPESLRFSRAITFLGAIWAIVSLTSLRLLLNKLRIKKYQLTTSSQKRFAIIGKIEEAKRVHGLLLQTGTTPIETFYISPEMKDNEDKEYIGNISKLSELCSIFQIDEIIFCAENIDAQSIIEIMGELTLKNIDFKIAPPEALYIVGSNSIHTSGELYAFDLNAISKPSNKRIKRVVELTCAFLILILYPALFLFVKNRTKGLSNLMKICFGKISFVGYHPNQSNKNSAKDLPKLKKSLFFATDTFTPTPTDPKVIKQINTLYARDYKALIDIRIILKNWKEIGR